MQIVILGSGNIATQWGKAFLAAGHHITQVYSRTLANAAALAKLLSSQAIDNLADLHQDADLYVLALADTAIPTLLPSFPKVKGLVIHCSGATNMALLQDFENYGVAYPVQSFSKEVDISFTQIPFGIEANSKQNETLLFDLFATLSNKTFACNSEQRLAIHVAAVFANNFSNALFQVANELLSQHNLPFDLIRPIILETAAKVQNKLPKDVQTGPASRNDEITIRKHLQFISDNNEWQLIYQQITNLIKKRR